MIKTFLRRWYLLNNLYHYKRRRNNEDWAEKAEFLRWITGQKLDTPPHWYIYIKPRTFFVHFYVLDYLLNIKKSEVKEANTSKRVKELEKVVEECSGQGTRWIDKEGSNKITLSPKGMEIYSVSYLIFGNDYARKIWIGIVVALVVWFVTDRVKSVVFPKIEIRYINQ
jgi:hypothetical protein